MLVGAKVCDLTEDLLWFVCGLYVGILTSSLKNSPDSGSGDRGPLMNGIWHSLAAFHLPFCIRWLDYSRY